MPRARAAAAVLVEEEARHRGGPEYEPRARRCFRSALRRRALAPSILNVSSFPIAIHAWHAFPLRFAYHAAAIILVRIRVLLRFLRDSFHHVGEDFAGAGARVSGFSSLQRSYAHLYRASPASPTGKVRCPTRYLVTLESRRG
jgi:hypothetical protein